MYKDLNFLQEKQIGQFRIQKNNGLIELLGVIMSDSDIEKRLNEEIIEKSNGDVFIAGLGLGLIVLPIQDKENVKSITILERYRDVINLVGKQLPLNDKVRIIEGNIFEYIPERKYDTMYIDIYGEETRQLNMWFKEKFSKYLVDEKENPNRYIGGFN